MTAGTRRTRSATAAADRHAAARLAAVVRTSHDAIIGQDVAGVITSWNPAAERLYGYPAEEMIGQLGGRLAHEDFVVAEAALLARVLDGESVELVRTHRVHQGGAVLDVSLSMSPVVDAHATIVGLVSASRDVTAPAAAEPQSQMLLEAAADAMVCVDADGIITLINDRAPELFGYDRAELIGAPIEILGPSTALAFRPALRRDAVVKPMIRAVGGPAQLSAVRKDGTTFPADISLGSVDLGGSLIVTAAIRDVTERIAVQSALQESETLFRQLAASVEVAFLVRRLDPPAFLYVSPAYLRILGIDPMAEQESPKASLNRIHPEDRDRVMAEYWALSSQGQPTTAEYRIVRPDGEVRWIRAANAPIYEADGSVRRTATTVEDITDRRRGEAALVAAANLARDNAAKNEFLSRMSHELRTPLNAVLGFAQLLELDALSGAQQEAVHHILRGGRHLLSLIDDVLDIAKIEADRLDISIEAVRVSELVSETVALMTPLAAAAAVQLTIEPFSADRFVQGDSRRLRQVMLNLLSNAIKYNRPGGRVDVRSQISDESCLDILVSDTGPGIHADDLPRLFTPFDRLGAQSTGVEGSGVGLALSQRLMGLMGGRLHAVSEVGGGSTFTASIPLAAAPPGYAGGPPVIAVARPNAPVAPVGAPTRTLLYIEDNTSNIQLMEQLMGHRPAWRMVVAGHGALGLELATTTPLDLILLDLHLPDMNGLDILRRMRADPRTRDLRVVVVSADANPHQIERLRAAGADGYLTKPLIVSEVFALLDADGPGADSGAAT